MIRKLTPSNGISPFSGQYGQQSSQGTTPIPVPLGGGGGGGGGGSSGGGSNNVEGQYEQVINLAKQIRKKILMSNFDFLKKLLDKVPNIITAKIIEAPHGIQLWASDNNVEAPLPVFAITDTTGHPYTDIGVYSPKLYKVQIDAESIYEYIQQKHAELTLKYKISYCILQTNKGRIICKLTNVSKITYSFDLSENNLVSFVYPKDNAPKMPVRVYANVSYYEFEVNLQYCLSVGCAIGYIGYESKKGELVGGYGVIMEVVQPGPELHYVQFPKIGTLEVSSLYTKMLTTVGVGIIDKIITDNWTLVAVR